MKYFRYHLAHPVNDYGYAAFQLLRDAIEFADKTGCCVVDVLHPCRHKIVYQSQGYQNYYASR
jgi:hypothetical protein